LTLKKCKSPDIDQIPAEMIQSGSEILLYEIHELLNSNRKLEELPDLLYQFEKEQEAKFIMVNKRMKKMAI
jgi:hypothetical protein